MSRTLDQEYTAVILVPATTTAATITGAAVNTEPYGKDGMVVANVNALGSNASVTVTVTGSLVATPTVYDQTLATFVTSTTGGTAAAQIKLDGIKNIKGVATLGGSTVCAVTVVALLQDEVKSASDNSATLA